METVDAMGGLRRSWRLLFTGLIIGIVAVLVVARRAEVAAVLETGRRAQGRWLLAAVALQVVVYANFAAANRRSLMLVGYHASLRSLYGIVFLGVVRNRLIPTSGAALVVYHLNRRGVPSGVAAAGVSLNALAGFAA